MFATRPLIALLVLTACPALADDGTAPAIQKLQRLLEQCRAEPAALERSLKQKSAELAACQASRPDPGLLGKKIEAARRQGEAQERERGDAALRALAEARERVAQLEASVNSLDKRLAQKTAPDPELARLATRLRTAEQERDEARRALAALQTPKAARPSYEPEMVDIPGKDYAMGKYEVTQAQYQACVDDGGCKPPEWLEAGSKYHIHTGSDVYYKKHLGTDRPAVGVSWNDAQSYGQWLSRKTGKAYRLPTEKEWKHACDGGASHKYCGGDNLRALGWYDGNSGGQTHPVGQKQANGYGLYDMTGNVWEWQQDCYDGDCSRRVLRGGSWYYFPESARAAYRSGDTPSGRYSINGFRVARSARTH